MEDLNGLRGLPSKMEKITDKIAALPHNANYFSLEFFPPKTQEVGVLLCTLDITS